MSFVTAALTAYGGYGRGKQQKFEDTLEQRRLADTEKDDTQNRELTQQQILAAQTANTQSTTNRTFESGLKYPPNWDKMSPSDKYNYLTVRYNAAQHAGDTQAVGDTLALMNSLPRAGYEFAETTTQGYKDQLLAAQTYVQKTLPARALQIAGMNNSTRLQVEASRIANSQYLATYNGNLRIGLAQLAGAYHIQGLNDEDATRRAIADYNGSVQAYRVQMNPEQSLLNPNYQQPGAPAPITINVGDQSQPKFTPGDYTGGDSAGGGPPKGLKPGEVPAYKGQSLNPQTGLPYPAAQPVQKIAPMKALNDAKQKLAQGWTPAQLDKGLQQLVRSGALDPRAATQIEIQLGLKTAAGGSFLSP